MRTAIAATLCLTFGCASSSPSLEKASIGSLSFGTPSGWTSRDVSSPQRKMFEWSPTDNERKESLTIIRSDRPAMAKATPVQLQHLMRDAQGVMRDASFSAPISFTTRHGFRGVRIEGSFLPRGQDVMFEYANRSPDGLWEEFRIKQPGHHYQWLRRRLAAPNDYQLKTLSGEILVYNSSGRLTELWDSLATPNKTLLVYSGGQLSTVTDATGKRRLQFLYTSNQLTTVRFQIFTISWLNKHTTTYS